jgi:Ca-activated chloride channel homolog
MSARRPWVAVLVALLALAPLGGAAARTYVQLVLDASGSMYNRLEDGRYRIVAAKDVLAGFIANLPDDPDLNVGLRVYGSRQDARDAEACDDSHLLVPMRGVDREALLESLREVQARGATPIARSLALAGEDFTEPGRHVVVLVTDGAESCGGDVRATLDALRARGIELDLRIVGIDLAPFAVTSFEGLGTFENARSAAELAAALGRAVEQTVAPTAERHPVEVLVTRAGTPATDGLVVQFVDAVDGTTVQLESVAAGRFTASLAAGAYVAEIADVFSEAPLRIGGLTVRSDAKNRFAFEIAPALTVTLGVDPQEPLAGGSVTVRFEGAPAAGRHWLTLVGVDTPDEMYTETVAVEGANGEARLVAPSEVATVEARYLLTLPEGGTRVIGRSAPVTTVAAAISLEAPAEVSGGSPFAVHWTGPDHADDYLTIVPRGAPEGTYLSYAYTSRGNPAQLTAPLEPGAYELRYTSEASRGLALASRPIQVVASAYDLDGPDEVTTGAAFEVHWTGPNNPSDYVTIVPAGAPTGSYQSYAYTASGNPVALAAPMEPGRYEVRYTTDQSGHPTFASQLVEVLAAEYGLELASRIVAGAPFEVTWIGPDGPGDYITIVPAGAPEGSYGSYAYTGSGNPVQLDAPDDRGAFEVRYQSDRVSGTLFSLPVRVE